MRLFTWLQLLLLFYNDIFATHGFAFSQLRTQTPIIIRKKTSKCSTTITITITRQDSSLTMLTDDDQQEEHRMSFIDESCIADPNDDTVRVRIWQALASGDEMSLRQLGVAVGERRQGELRSHLRHVEKQAQTMRNKSTEWRKRRGLDPTVSKARLVQRQTKNDIFVQFKK